MWSGIPPQFCAVWLSAEVMRLMLAAGIFAYHLIMIRDIMSPNRDRTSHSSVFNTSA